MSEAAAERLAAAGLGPDAPLMILSGNSIEHAVIHLAAMRIRAPVAPLSQAYSLASTDFGKLKSCFEIVRPKALFVQSAGPFAAALAALPLDDLIVISADDTPPAGVVRYLDLIGGQAGTLTRSQMDEITDDSVAKFMFTSGSTGAPKAVVQTQGMLCAQIAALNGLLEKSADPRHVPDSLEWMPWSHISAGSIGLYAILADGATLYLDDGKPVPGAFDLTIKNLYEVSPEVFGSAPIAYTLLADAMERDTRLRHSFFRNLKFMSYGGAALSNDLYQRLQVLAVAETGYQVPFTTMYGATETLGITVVNWLAERSGLIGLPIPGVTLKLVPHGPKYEVRVRGATVMNRYHGDPKRTATAFDEEGFYMLGDAVRLIDPSDARQGLAFDGRLTEDFKLVSGTWVSVGTLRPAVVAACSPYVSDMVIAGEGQEFQAALLWLSPLAVRQMSSDSEGAQRMRAAIQAKLVAFNAEQTGSSRRIARALILDTPPSIDDGEITDKGYINQRTALAKRAAQVTALYAAQPGPEIILA